jgi:ParB family transcriptional regulator, chromosome partitioning protein
MYGIRKITKLISKSPSYVSKRIRLLDLPVDVMNLISESEIHVSSVEELLAVKDKRKQYEISALLQNSHLSSRKVRQLMSNISSPNHNFDSYIESERYSKSYSTIDRQHNLLRSIDSAIIALRIAVRKLISIIDDIEEEWILYEAMMQHKKMLVTQIDILIKERKKARKLISLRYL